MTDKYKKGSQGEVILEKSSSLFWEKGYTETSMKDIAAACGFRPANIYNFFTNKEEILFEILREEMEEILSPIRPLENDESLDPRTGVRKIVEHHVKLTLGKKRSSMILFDVGLKNLSSTNRKKIIRLRDEYNRIAVKIVKSGMEQGIFVKTDAKLAVFSIASIIARSRIWYSPKGKFSVDEIIDFIYSFALRGLGERDN